MKFSGQIQFAATDLSNHLSCPHLTQLNRKLALKEIPGPTYRDPALDVLAQRGLEHENAYVAYLKSKNLSVAELRGKPQSSVIDAMQKGTDVIVQAQLEDGPWMGYADILIKRPGKSSFGQYLYEVQDTKLAHETRAATILQLCVYSELVAKVQQADPECMHVVKPGDNFPTESYRTSHYQAYYRFVKQNFEFVMAGAPPATYPDPVAHCSICRWWQICDRRRHDDDHLSLVAGMRSSQIVELQAQHIDTLAKFAVAPKLERPQRGHRESLLRKQPQAKIQLDGRVSGQPQYSFREPEAGRGFFRLPEPADGDVYFDIEGDAFYPDGGLEYVFGYAYRDKGELVYKRHRATNRREEKKAFTEFIEFVSNRWKKYPRLYIYHFAPYEPSAIKRLARTHATHETEVDNLLRAERFIDLHAVFKEGLIASVERYSLKELEKFTEYKRKIELHDASVARKNVEVALELNQFHLLPEETMGIVEQYNADDCFATEALHRWLEKRRSERIEQGFEIGRPAEKSPDASEKVQEQETRALALYTSLTRNLPDDRTTWTDEQKARWLLAHQVDYFRREDKSVWWEYYRVHDMEGDDLLDERKALTGLTYVQELPKAKGARMPTHRYTFPAQECSINIDDRLIEVRGEEIGKVQSISQENHTIDIKKTGKSIDRHPEAVHVKDRVNIDLLARSLQDVATAIDEDGLAHIPPYQAARDLLMRRSPKLPEGVPASLQPGEKITDAAIRLALHLDNSVLAIQGPPGTGKTHTGACMISALVKAGKKVGITAVSHKVIRNLSEETMKLDDAIRFVHKVKEISEDIPNAIKETKDSDEVRAGIAAGAVGCGTAWIWSEENSTQLLDYLFVDEAGQMSLAHVLAASRSTRNIILLGDPQQLEQPQQGSHPEGSDVAALAYLLDGHPTMPEGKGLFLGTTRRLHPDICRFTSEIFYENRLTSLPGLEHQAITGTSRFNGSGLRLYSVTHKGNSSIAPEEVDAVVSIVHELLEGSWTNENKDIEKLHPKDVLIVAPYNAQVTALANALPHLRIGTVDKFQGQQAPVVIYSMTSSTPEDAPRGMNFLFNPNRLNVATSRARCLCILVANPRLFEASCRTIPQMAWANALCRYRELSGTIANDQLN